MHDLAGVKFLRWFYERDIQDIDANIEMAENGGFFAKLAAFYFGFPSVGDWLSYLKNRRNKIMHFMEVTK